MRRRVKLVLFALVTVGFGVIPQVIAQPYTVGGAVYTDLGNPLTSGLSGVAVTVDGDAGTFEGATAGPSGIWFVSEVPQGTYSVMPALNGLCFRHVQAEVVGPPPPIIIVVDADHQAENLSIQFLTRPGCATRFDCNQPACASCETGCCVQVLGPFADVNHDGIVNLDDVFCVLDVIGNAPFAQCSHEDVDIKTTVNAQCGPDGIVNLSDIFGVLDTISGVPPCPDCS